MVSILWVVFYDISTIVGYLMLNPVNPYTSWFMNELFVGNIFK